MACWLLEEKAGLARFFYVRRIRQRTAPHGLKRTADHGTLDLYPS